MPCSLKRTVLPSAEMSIGNDQSSQVRLRSAGSPADEADDLAPPVRRCGEKHAPVAARCPRTDTRPAPEDRAPRSRRATLARCRSARPTSSPPRGPGEAARIRRTGRCAPLAARVDDLDHGPRCPRARVLDEAEHAPSGDTRTSLTQPAASSSTVPIGYSSRLAIPDRRVTARLLPSGDQSASWTFSRISRGAPPASGTRASVPIAS